MTADLRAEVLANLTRLVAAHDRTVRAAYAGSDNAGYFEARGRFDVELAALRARLAEPEPNAAHYVQTVELADDAVQRGYRDAQHKLWAWEAEMRKRGFPVFTAPAPSAPAPAPDALAEPSEEAVTVAMAVHDYDGGSVRPGCIPTANQTRSLVRNKLRAAYAVDAAALRSRPEPPDEAVARELAQLRYGSDHPTDVKICLADVRLHREAVAAARERARKEEG